jgi:hypothetical protein
MEIETRPYDTEGLLSLLVDSGAMHYTTRPYLLDLLKHGAFIAGGFARVVMADFERRGPEAIGGYLGTSKGETFDQYKHDKNDIDVFFPDERTRNHCIRLFPFPMGSSHVSPGGNAVNVLHGKQTIVQVVTKFTSPVDQMLKRFDMTNGCVAFTKDKLHIVRGWEELEASKLLHVNHWNHIGTLRRVGSWMSKHGYTDLHPDSVPGFNAAMIALFERVSTDEIIMGSNGSYVEFDKYKFLSFAKRDFALKNSMGYFLTLLASLTPFYDDYNWAANELKRRIRLECTKNDPKGDKK